MSTLTELYHEKLLAEQGEYRTGDRTHEHLGDVQVECRDCHGSGRVETSPPWTGTTSCDACRGRGYVWQERPLTPEEYQAEIDRLRAKLARYETTLQLIASAAKAALDGPGGSIEGTG